MSSADGGLYKFGVLPGYGFIFLIIVVIAIVTIIIPGVIIFYVIKVPSTSTEYMSSTSSVPPGAPEKSSAEMISDEEFDGW